MLGVKLTLKAFDKKISEEILLSGDCTNATESEKHETACVKEDDVSDDGLTVLSIQRHRGFSAKERRKIIRKNVIQILQNSTLTPFRWLRKFYRCFFCREIFKTPNEWRLHQSLHNFTKELHVAVNSYWESVVYVDVSNIACKLCTDAITDLNELIDHLVNKHGIKFNEAIGRCMSAFKLDDNFVYCLCCDKKFYTFSHVLVHTNKDHKGGNDVLCDICGQYYRSLIYLRYHIRSEHSDGVKCRQCGILLRYTKLRTHMQNVHGKKYKCFNCLEMFETQYKRAQHTMNVHGDRKVISCQYCAKTFVYKSTMLRHVKESHLRERNTQCNICGWKSFAVYALQRHMIKHSTVRSVKCPSCDKTFKTNKTMKQHCINIHQKS
ncbi:unnamed protein product [Parnassius apollo]|uniref:(apollo) hypothetical protein n=1 Tax=Parnassius apollo TaxID=110799 RepID=A0A8S3Y8Y5_PARAO|nr:unnamed protein product [Parnassius apollo]